MTADRESAAEPISRTPADHHQLTCEVSQGLPVVHQLQDAMGVELASMST